MSKREIFRCPTMKPANRPVSQCGGSRLFALIAGASLLVIAGHVVAQTSSSAQSPAPASSAPQAGPAELEEIVVTARRKTEKLENVPQTVTAVSAQSIQKLNLLKIEDVTALVPGLTLESGSTGYNSAASVRGVTFDEASQTTGTVQFYLNEAPVDPNQVFQSLFDLDQIEVLRGPQGTLHGESSPSGAITVVTKRPIFNDFGGYVSTTGTDLGNVNGQGAVNIPIIQDKLALRVAGLIDNNDFNGVRSIHNPADPNSRSEAARASLRFEPTDDITANLVYQHLDRRLISYTQVAGPGIGYNGPLITPDQRLAVSNTPDHLAQKFDILNANVGYSFLGQKLSYVGSFERLRVHAFGDSDPGNMIPAGRIVGDVYSTEPQQSHELRLSSDEPGRFWDYTAGVFLRRTTPDVDVTQVANFLAGAFGPPNAPSPLVYNPKYQLGIHILGPSEAQEFSAFGNVTLHLDDATELTAGLRWINYKQQADTVLSTVPGALIALAGSCANGTYPGYCDAHVPRIVIEDLAQNRKDRPIIYSASISHKFTDDLMVYFNSGSSWRPGPAQIGLFNAEHNPVMDSLIYLNPETSYSFEGGVKWSFLEHRGIVNLAYYHQIYQGLLFKTLPVQYFSDNGPQKTIATFPFTASADALVDGVDADVGFQVTPEWNVHAALSFSDGRVDNAAIPCNPPLLPNGMPVPGTLSITNPVNLCKSNGSVSRAPLWSATVQSEYSMPITDEMDGFVRGLFTFYPSNDRSSQNFTADAYGLLNIYAGLRSADGGWEASIFAKNAFSTTKTLALDYPGIQNANFGFSGYQQSANTAMVTPRREVGITVTYSFGSR